MFSPSDLTALPEGFDAAYYLMVYGDVAEAGMDPIDHYRRFGRAEGRSGVPPGIVHPAEREMRDRHDFMAKAFSAISVNGIEGDYLEFGVAHGKTMWAAWRASRTLGLHPRLWAFDSFVGLPEPTSEVDTGHPSWQKGRYAVTQDRFRTNLQSMGVADDVHVVPGFFSDTLIPENRGTLPTSVALAYVDCDMYASTVDVLDYLRDIVTTGSIVAFDDWFCWSPTGRSGEQIALEEMMQSCPELQFNSYIPIGWHGMSFFVTRS
jgi:O-methyltransferase